MVTVFGATHTGLVRRGNEDSYLINDDIGLYVIADGMGGHSAGEVASRMAVDVIRAFIERSLDGDDFTWPFGIDGRLSFQANCVATAVKLANRRVYRAAESRDDYVGMGTTVVVALCDGTTVTYGSVGDSRLYAFSQGHLRQLTRDDSWLQTVRELEGHDDAALERHAMRNVLTKVVGAQDDIEVPVAEYRLEAGDALLMCTDGLHALVEDAAIAEILARASGPEATATMLIDAALERGGRDNVTALLLTHPDAAE